MMSTQVLKLEDKVKELMMKLSAALSDKDFLAQVSNTICELYTVHHYVRCVRSFLKSIMSKIYDNILQMGYRRK